jgi:hypothetical protein
VMGGGHVAEKILLIKCTVFDPLFAIEEAIRIC